MGDYFLVGDLDKELIARLQNVPYEETAVRQALEGVRIEDIIMHLTVDEFVKALFK